MTNGPIVVLCAKKVGTLVLLPIHGPASGGSFK
jgi:hypothetical protein